MYDIIISKLNSFEITVGSGLVFPSNFWSMSSDSEELILLDSESESQSMSESESDSELISLVFASSILLFDFYY